MCDVLIRVLKRSLASRFLSVKKHDPPFYYRGLRQISEKQPIAIQYNTETQSRTSKDISKAARHKLQAILEVKEIEALELLSSCKKLLFTPNFLILRNYEICLKNNLSKKIILNNSFLLCEQKLTHKIARLENLPINLSSSIPLAKLSLRKLFSVLLNSSDSMDRINYLCQIFNITVDKACDLLSKKPFIFTKPLVELEELLNIFYDYNFTSGDIMKDLWIFKYSEAFIRNRLDFVKDHDINSLKTWMIRCPEDTLYRHIKRVSDNRDILGENSIAQYLSEKLQCNENIAKSIIRKHPQLQSKSLLKMNVMIDLLYRQGFSPTQICKLPKVLLHSTKTTEQRLEELNTLGKKPDNLYILIKSQKQYLQHIENFMKAKSKGEIAQ